MLFCWRWHKNRKGKCSRTCKSKEFASVIVWYLCTAWNNLWFISSYGWDGVLRIFLWNASHTLGNGNFWWMPLCCRIESLLINYLEKFSKSTRNPILVWWNSEQKVLVAISKLLPFWNSKNCAWCCFLFSQWLWTTLQYMMSAKISQQRFQPCHYNG